MSGEKGVPRGPEKPGVDWFISGTTGTESKLESYVLSPFHPVGRHKARLWSSVFDLRQGDGELLERLMGNGGAASHP